MYLYLSCTRFSVPAPYLLGLRLPSIHGTLVHAVDFRIGWYTVGTRSCLPACRLQVFNTPALPSECRRPDTCPASAWCLSVSAWRLVDARLSFSQLKPGFGGWPDRTTEQLTAALATASKPRSRSARFSPAIRTTSGWSLGDADSWSTNLGGRALALRRTGGAATQAPSGGLLGPPG
ncbi:hypothetical protein V8C42DRAFT_20490 [Trichoderma barbatum]